MPDPSPHLHKAFKLLTEGGPEHGHPTSMGDYEMAYDNPYVSIYGSPVEDYKPPSQLDVGESTLLRFSLSRQQPTTYRLIRVK